MITGCHVARSFTTSLQLAAPHYLDVLYRDSKAPVWRLLDTLQSSADRHHINAALAEAGVSLDEYVRWRPILAQHDIQQAIAHAESGVRMPPWVVLFLVLFKVRTVNHASNALPAVLHAHLSSMPESLQAPLLVLAAYQLARNNLIVPLQALTDTFLTWPIPIAAQETAFNLFLHALSRAPLRSAVLSYIAVRILAAMDARQVAIRPATYRALLADRFVTLQLTKHLMTRMASEPDPPTAEHLERFLRVFARDGAIKQARKYYTAIHSIMTDPPPADDDSLDPRYAANTLMLSASENKASAFVFLRRLAQLSSHTTSKPFKPPPIRFVTRSANNIYDQTAALHVAARDLRTTDHMLIQAFLRLHARPTVATHTVLIRGLLFRKSWTRAAFFWTRLERACLAGTGVKPPVRFRPEARSYTSSTPPSTSNTPQAPRWTRPTSRVSGELLRTPPAWARARGRRMVMDNAALTSGLQALVRVGRPSNALATLDFWAWRADLPEDATVGRRRPSRPRFSSSPSSKSSLTSPSSLTSLRAPARIHPTTITYNELLASFLRSPRPNAVFLLWDLMPFYGVTPDATSLGVLLQAARKTIAMDDNVRGAVERVRMAWTTAWTSLRMKRSAPDTGAGTAGSPGYKGITHDHPGVGFDGLLSPTLPLLLNTHEQLRVCLLKPYVPGQLWRGRPPADAARAVFLQALFGMCEGLGEGHGNREGVIVAPAAAVRDAWDAEARNVFRAPRPYVFTPPDGVLLRPPLTDSSSPPSPSPPSSSSPSSPSPVPASTTASLSPSLPPSPPRTFYPTLAPTSRSCLSYLSLLASADRVPEIPLFLAWMRRAGVQPSNSVLGMALALWAEVGVQAPVVEMLQARAAAKGSGKKSTEKGARGHAEEGDAPEPYNIDIDRDPSEYSRLVRYVRDWVGPERVPGPRDLAKWRGVVLAMRSTGGGL